ncbi:hypothetical protein DQ244_15525 [Blastococcus sp. TBT05-19]|nr:hypothetical protein DQ244_15525 [Blastococcus sp. TBT05-19]
MLPHEEWRQLGASTRRRVRAAARRGRSHPDPYVAAVAHAWAQEVVRLSGRSAPTPTGIAGTVLGVAVILAIAAFLDVSPGGSSGYSWRERRLARRILALPPV